MRSRYEFDEIVLELIMKDKWIIDGNYSRTLKVRAKRADLIIFLTSLPIFVFTEF
ncbi:MAG: hypothetical protein IPG78_08285 [Ignavibacteria bacterium]|nr:hypothetical protein [Ignavibacteria bacterium]